MIGRSDDLIVVKGVNFFPSSVTKVLAQFLDGINGEFQIVVGNTPPIETLKIQLEYRGRLSSAEIESLKEAIQQRMKSKLFINPELNFIPEGSLEKSADGKIRRVVREWQTA